MCRSVSQDFETCCGNLTPNFSKHAGRRAEAGCAKILFGKQQAKSFAGSFQKDFVKHADRCLYPPKATPCPVEIKTLANFFLSSNFQQNADLCSLEARHSVSLSLSIS